MICRAQVVYMVRCGGTHRSRPTHLSRDGIHPEPYKQKKPDDLTTIRFLSCWRYLSFRAVSSQVLSAEVSLTDLSRDGVHPEPPPKWGGQSRPPLRNIKETRTFLRTSGFLVLALPIFPGRLQPSIVGRSELNFRVRDGNGWTLALISTNYLGFAP